MASRPHQPNWGEARRPNYIERGSLTLDDNGLLLLLLLLMLLWVHVVTVVVVVCVLILLLSWSAFRGSNFNQQRTRFTAGPQRHHKIIERRYCIKAPQVGKRTWVKNPCCIVREEKELLAIPGSRAKPPILISNYIAEKAKS